MTITSKNTTFYAKPSAEISPQLKSAGWRYMPSQGSWMTSDIRKVLALVDLCDEDTANKVVKWQTRRAEAIASSVAIDTGLEIPAPPGLSYRGYQKAGIAFMKARHSTLNADVPRLGKTIQSLGLINTYDYPLRVLVICPANAKVHWTREADKWLMHKGTVGYIEGDKNPDTDFLVINYTILTRHLSKIQTQDWDVIVVDEAHFLGNPDSQRTQSVMALEAKLHFVFLTGTPIYTRPRQLFPMLAKMDSKGLGAKFFRYATRYCNGHMDEGGRWNFNGSSNEEELQFRLRKTVMLRREKSDVLTELPTQRQTITLPKTGLSTLIKREKSAFKQKYEDLFERLQQNLTEEDFECLKDFDSRQGEDADWTDDDTVPLATLRRELALAKVSMVIDFVEELLLSEHKVVVFAHHRDVVMTLASGLSNFSPVMVIGGMTTVKRQEAIDRFRDDPTCQVFVGNIMAAGSAISLAAADTAVFAELSWVPSEVDQAEERIWDPTKTRPVSIYRLVLEDSLEERIAYVMEARQAQIDRMMMAKYLVNDELPS